MRSLILFLVLLSGCTTVDVMASDGDTHTLRIDTDKGISSPAVVERKMHRQAAALCPDGWDRLDEHYVPREKQSAILSPTVAVEWRIRCL